MAQGEQRHWSEEVMFTQTLRGAKPWLESRYGYSTRRNMQGSVLSIPLPPASPQNYFSRPKNSHLVSNQKWFL